MLPTNFKDFAIRVIIFEVTFYFIITIFVINIVYAVVVHTFIELRDEVQYINELFNLLCTCISSYSGGKLIGTTNKFVTRSEKSRLPRTQQQDTLFTIKC